MNCETGIPANSTDETRITNVVNTGVHTVCEVYDNERHSVRGAGMRALWSTYTASTLCYAGVHNIVDTMVCVWSACSEERRALLTTKKESERSWIQLPLDFRTDSDVQGVKTRPKQVEMSRILGRNIKTERRGGSSGKFEINSDKIVFRRCESRETDRKLLEYNYQLYRLIYCEIKSK
jgi:hypothetical protein